MTRMELPDYRTYMPFVTWEIRRNPDFRFFDRLTNPREGRSIESSYPMSLRIATLADIPAIMALEGNPVARLFVGQWSEDRHRTTLTGGDARYYVNEQAGNVDAYVILRGLGEDSRSIELKRIVVGRPEQGLGRRILTEIIRIAFRELGAHRLFLDVFEDNARARHLYESLGFKYEGVMRESAQRDGRWFNLHLMSILESEYN